jgi:hypothetical protein
MANFHTDPGYQFQLDQGLRAVGAHQAAAGMFDSGATEKAQMTFAGGLADQSFSQYYNRLYGLANLGETAAAGGAATANSAATLAQGAGNTQASIFGNAASGLGTTISGLASNPKINSLFSGGGSTLPPAPAGGDFQFSPE